MKRLLFALGIATWGVTAARPATFTVTTTNNAGAGSLRQAILDANAAPGGDFIAFNLAAGGLTLSPTNALPPLTEAVTIDGATQPGFAGTPIVEVNGASAGANADGFRLWAGNSLIRSLVINRFNGDGIEIATNGNNVVEGCFIGLSVSGTIDLGNNVSGIFITNSPNNRIGGTNAEQRNVISGNQQNGVLIQGLGAAVNSVLGNIIGLNAAGGVPIANGANGIFLSGARGNTIGGGGSGAGNVISGNTQSGLRLEGTNAHANAIGGNIIGLDPAGAVDLGNGQQGVMLFNAPTNIIGGTNMGNVISGNGQAGVRLEGASTRGNVVLGNLIGTDRTGTLDLGNDGDGLHVLNAPDNAIGGSAVGAGNLVSGNNNDGIELNGSSTTNNVVAGNRLGVSAAGSAMGNGQNGIVFNSAARFNTVGVPTQGGGNLIAFNGANGVLCNSGTNNAVRATRIFSNGALGLDLGSNGATPNDAGDGDTGVNQLQNFPVITGGTIHPASVQVSGALNSRPNVSYVLDFFANLVCDASGHGEGQQFLGSAVVTTDGSGNAAFSVTFDAIPVGRYLTATATDTNGNTSEFSACFAAASTLPPVTLTVTNVNDSGPGSLREALLDADSFPSGSPNIIAFNIPGAGPHTISPLTQLPTNREPVLIDGYSQPGASANTLAAGNNAVLMIRLDGASAFGTTGLRLRASGSQVRGLSITRFAGEGVQINGASNCVVAGNFIGLAPDGAIQANRANGVQIFDSPGNRVGGAAPADRNVLSGNFSAGVHLLGIGASNNVVEGNLIGTSPDGSAARANFVNGVYVQDASGNRIGGATPGARNVISGNTPDGVRVSGFESVGNVIVGNFIGPSANGVARLGGQNGVHVDGGAMNRVGGSVTGEANVISGNHGYGVRIGDGAVGTLVLGNRIGVGPAGGVLSNGAQGVLIRGNATRIGGVMAGEGNEIAYNAPGIEMELGTGNTVRGNSIHDNNPRFVGFGGLGIDLAPLGVTANDAVDADGGANLLQNFPSLTAATSSGASTRVQGTLNSRPSATFALDFYSNPDCDPSGHGEGLKYLGATSVMTDGLGNASFDVTLPAAAEGRQITATTTDASGNTSEFSPCFAASVGQAPRTFFVTNTSDSGPGSLRQALLDAQASPASANNIVAFNIGAANASPRTAGILAGAEDSPLQLAGRDFGDPRAAGGANEPFTIRLTTPLATVFEGVTIDGFTQAGASANTLTDGNNAVWRIRLDGSLLGAGVNGLNLDAPGCIVRGLEVAGFRGAGIHFTGGGDSGFVEGCHLFDNQTDGLCADHASGLTIGGVSPASRNVIHRNGVGILITGVGATDNVIVGNWIGPDPAGAGGSGNFGEGINILGASGNLIGGTASGAGNRIAHNLRTGVTIFSGAGNAILGNSIVDNVGPAIDLLPGANGDLVAPTVSSATIRADGLDLSGTFRGVPNTPYTLQAFSSLTANAGGEYFLGGATATTDGTGIANFTVATGGNFIGRHLTVTATGPNEGTSEFSTAFTPDSIRLPGTFTVTTTADVGPGSLRQALMDADNFLAAGNNLIAFNIAGAGVKLIQPLTPFILPDGPVTINGFTQPGSQPNTLPDGYNGVYLIQLDGAQQRGGAGLSLFADGSVVRGLSVTRFATGIQLAGAGGHILEGNLIGVDPFFQPAGNTGDGVEITSPNNRVGGTNPEDQNVIGANGGNGIGVITPQAGFNEFLGNFLGVDFNPAANGLRVVGNGGHGIQFRLGASNNRVGGNEPGSKNVFGFNALNAVSIESGLRNTILNNEFIVQPLPVTAAKLIARALGANNNIPAPTLERARSDNEVTRLGLRYFGGPPNTTYGAKFWTGDRVAGGPYNLRNFKLTHQFNFTTDASGNASREEIIPRSYEQYTRGFVTVQDPNGNSSAASDFVKVIAADSADLQTQLFAPRSAIVGDNFTMTIVVSNSGPATATNATLRQHLAPNVELVSVSGAPPPVVNGNALDFALGNLASGEARTITLVARGTKLTQYVPSARARHQGRDPDTGNNSESRYVQFVAPPNTPQADIAITDAAVLANTGVAGDLVTLNFKVTNRGASDASGVQAAINLPRGGIVESATGSSTMQCEIGNGSVLCTMDTLRVDGTVDITVQVRIPAKAIGEGDPGFPANSRFVGIKAFSNTHDPRLGNNEGFVEVLAESRLALNAESESISWPAALNDMELQSTRDVTPPATWTAVPGNSITTVNGVSTYEFKPQADGSPAQRLFRLAEKPPGTPQAEFNQVSVEFDGTHIPFTDWGQVELTLPRSDVVRYANVSCDGKWVIQNVPILSGLSGVDGGVADRFCMKFPLRGDGAPVFIANTGFSITTDPAVAPPPSTAITLFGVVCYTMDSGEQGVRLIYTPAQPLVGGPALRTAQAKPNFPNREQRKNECAPAAIVNSLQYLNANFGLNLPEADIRLQTIKDAMGWTPSGAPVGDDPMNPDWVQAKAQYMRDRNLPIVTEVTTNAALALAAVRSMYDVEIRMPGHVAAVVGVTELDGGRYSLTLAHDVAQGKNGGDVLEVVTLDTNTGTVGGTFWSSQFAVFVIERPGP